MAPPANRCSEVWPGIGSPSFSIFLAACQAVRDTVAKPWTKRSGRTDGGPEIDR